MTNNNETDTWGSAAIGDPSLCRARAYIYCGYSRRIGVAYIGMTVGRNGVLGRWADHLGRALERSSFRRRVHEFDESAWERIDDLVIVWSEIGEESVFLAAETSHRESVEYLVQREMRNILAAENAPITVVSKVRSNPTAQLALVQDAADRVLNAFRKHFSVSP